MFFEQVVVVVVGLPVSVLLPWPFCDNPRRDRRKDLCTPQRWGVDISPASPLVVFLVLAIINVSLSGSIDSIDSPPIPLSSGPQSPPIHQYLEHHDPHNYSYRSAPSRGPDTEPFCSLSCSKSNSLIHSWPLSL